MQPVRAAAAPQQRVRDRLVQGQARRAPQRVLGKPGPGQDLPDPGDVELLARVTGGGERQQPRVSSRPQRSMATAWKGLFDDRGKTGAVISPAAARAPILRRRAARPSLDARTRLSPDLTTLASTGLGSRPPRPQTPPRPRRSP